MEEIINILIMYSHLIKKIVNQNHTLMIETKMYSSIVTIEFIKLYIH